MNIHALELADLGFDVIPLTPGDKFACCADWQHLPPAEQWHNAPEGANIGIRGGGNARAVFLDCDDMMTFEHAGRYFAGLGYMPDGDYPLVRTARDRRHVYASLADVLPGDWRKLKRDFGKGELRYGPGSYVVGVGSVVNGRCYELVTGDFRQLPRLERADLGALIDMSATPALCSPTETPNLPRLAVALLEGKRAERYTSRSEAEYALIVALVNVGLDYGGILALFLTHPGPGKFAELQKERGEREALRYLRHSYDSAATWGREHESSGRKAAREAHAWALQRPWPGKTGNSDRAVFLAHTALAYQAGRVNYAASSRDLAEAAGVSFMTAQRANRRLLASGLLKVEKAHRDALAARFSLAENTRIVDTLPHVLDPWGSVSTMRVSSDAFRFRGLGKAAAQILDVLEAQPGLSAAGLAEATGRHIGTIRRRLAAMARIADPDTGEVLRLVERDGDVWRVVDDVDLDAVARILDTAGAGERQAKQHAAEREGFRRAIVRARAGDTPKRTTPAEVRADMGRADALIRVLRTPGEPEAADILTVLRESAPAALTLEELARGTGVAEGELAVRLDAL